LFSCSDLQIDLTLRINAINALKDSACFKRYRRQTDRQITCAMTDNTPTTATNVATSSWLKPITYTTNNHVIVSVICSVCS